MVHYGGRAYIDAVSAELHPPAQVYLLLMCEEEIIEAAHFVEDFRTDEHGCSAGPEDRLCGIILSAVGFAVAENPSSAKGISVAVNPSTGGAGVFESGPVVPVQDFRLAGGNVVVRLHQFDNRFDPVRCDFHIGIQQYEDVGFHLFQCSIIPLCKSFICFVDEQFHVRVYRPEECQGIIRGGIVCDHDAKMPIAGSLHGWKESFQKRLAIVVQYDDCDGRRCVQYAVFRGCILSSKIPLFIFSDIVPSKKIRMLRQWVNWRSLFGVVAIVIVTATILYSRLLAGKIAAEERQKVEEWAQAQQFIARATPEQDILFASIVMAGQTSIPVIETNERDSITNHHNLDTGAFAQDTGYLRARLREFAKSNSPITTYLDDKRVVYNKYYYGESMLLKQVRYYPIVQLCIVALFIIITLMALSARHKAMQDQLWAGMAKETAHQLGTPLSALEGWVEMMKETPPDTAMIAEMEKDLRRLKLVSDRFSKIGSQPKLESHDLVHVVRQVVEYVKKRAPSKVQFPMDAGGYASIPAEISAPLFEWVVENLLKNALDAMDGSGEISVRIRPSTYHIHIDITDSGKGIASSHLSKVFQPGFTTKKRGWGLGLTLSRRIIEQYHGGQLTVRQSELGKGTTFRISILSPRKGMDDAVKNG